MCSPVCSPAPQPPPLTRRAPEGGLCLVPGHALAAGTGIAHKHVSLVPGDQCSLWRTTHLSPCPQLPHLACSGDGHLSMPCMSPLPRTSACSSGLPLPRPHISLPLTKDWTPTGPDPDPLGNCLQGSLSLLCPWESEELQLPGVTSPACLARQCPPPVPPPLQGHVLSCPREPLPSPPRPGQSQLPTTTTPACGLIASPPLSLLLFLLLTQNPRLAPHAEMELSIRF